MDTWSPGDLAAIANSDEVQLATRRHDRTLSRPVIIWIVRVGDDLYVRSAYGVDNPWFRRAVAQPSGMISAAGLSREVDFEVVGSASTDSIDAAYRAKYARYSPAVLNPMVSTTAAAATLRVLPHAEALTAQAKTAPQPGATS